jgi:hypothetical protein
MAVDYTDVDAIAATVADIYAQGEQALIAALTRQLGAGGFDDDTSVWAARKLTEVRALARAAQLIVDELQRDGNTAVRQAVADGLRSGNATAVVDLAEAHIGDTGPAARAASSATGAAVQALADATVAELQPVYSAVLRSTDDAYRKAVAGATARRLTGTRDTRRAAQDAWAALVNQGITGFTDRTGRRWRLHTYAEMATRTAVARAAIVGQSDVWSAAGIRDCYVVDNPRECPLCAPWETKILALSPDGPVVAPAVATLAAAQAAGLNHPNCRHQLRPWRSGVRISAARTAEGPDGYDAEQQQRALERKLRAWRERYAAAFDDQGRQHAAQRIASWSQALQDHLHAHPRLARVSHREKPGAGHTAATGSRTARDRAHLAGPR